MPVPVVRAVGLAVAFGHAPEPSAGLKCIAHWKGVDHAGCDGDGAQRGGGDDEMSVLNLAYVTKSLLNGTARLSWLDRKNCKTIS